MPSKSFSTLNKPFDSGVCKKNAGQLYSAKPHSPLHPPESNVDHGHDGCKERAKKKLETAELPMTLLLNIGRGGVGETATDCIRLYLFQRFFCKHRYTHRVCLVCYMCAHVLASEAMPHVCLTRLTCKT